MLANVQQQRARLQVEQQALPQRFAPRLQQQAAPMAATVVPPTVEPRPPAGPAGPPAGPAVPPAVSGMQPQPAGQSVVFPPLQRPLGPEVIVPGAGAIAVLQQAAGMLAGHAAEGGIRVSFPTPKLDVPSGTTPDPEHVRAFVADVRAYFGVAGWGENPTAQKLFLSGSLYGEAKRWHVTWTRAFPGYTMDQVFDALLTRFAPAVHTRAYEARQSLLGGHLRQQANEAVATFAGRFEALLQDLPELSEGDRVFHFRSALLPYLREQCAVSPTFEDHRTYAELRQHALGVEKQYLARADERLALKSKDPTIRGMAVASATGRFGRGNRGSGDSGPTGNRRRNRAEAFGEDRGNENGGGDNSVLSTYRGLDGAYIPRERVEAAAKLDLCFACLHPDHLYRECPQRL
ncbi:hypothetical protein TSOC_011779 [Tetrabaena socialis]|uniref:Retrotransposon gag domain-containing protein n=1 Tax=Tetrabaena socialis TaxID=47790 RepID=A0A2J7ZPS3_9CHLO|nr:hypothetical protein TSOC_011779 [Tetrabaena socialis]|eukprot:PNH02260.1 hypothetical protein TSOC_011779 [Tetrabaena socialis]